MDNIAKSSDTKENKERDLILIGQQLKEVYEKVESL